MRRRASKGWRRAALPLLLPLALLGGLWQFDRYVNTCIKPTLHKLAEYEARRTAAEAVAAAARTVQPQNLFAAAGESWQLDTAAVNALCVECVDAAQRYLADSGPITYTVPFGTLTNDTLLSDCGPGWRFSLQPRGYAQAQLRESTESLSVNTTRYTAQIELTLTMDLILDSRIETLTYTGQIPLVTLLLPGGVPQYYSQS